MEERNISLQTLRRLPVYLHYLKTIRACSPGISATAIALALHQNDVQVRKDLACVSGTGRPRTGYVTQELIEQLENYLGCRSQTRAVLMGAGNLGRALLSYDGFADYGLHIVAAFDSDCKAAVEAQTGIPVLPPQALPQICKDRDVHLGILTVPAQAAQSACDLLTENGIRAIWNFAPTVLRVPRGVAVENENLASSLAVLSMHLCGSPGKM